MECYDEWRRRKDNGGKYKWKNPKRFMKNFVPQNTDNIKVLFQICDRNEYDLDEDDSIMERVIWASYYPGNSTELKEQIDKRIL